MPFSDREPGGGNIAVMHDDIETRVFAVKRPTPELMKYYIIMSFAAGPLFFIPLIPLYFRYHTLRYEFDREGIAMSWGILFRRQITLTYARIQDIHLTSNLIERWLGLGRVQIQTASASADAEMTIEGIREFEMVRDYLGEAGFRVERLTFTILSPFPVALAKRAVERMAGRAGTASDADLRVPPAPINAAMDGLLRLEAAWLRVGNLPIGSWPVSIS